LKRLKGRLSGTWQYDLPSGYRLWYQVDDDARLVRVIYLGPHP
jgi:mRNA-degrading endonuclease RelE of RelBE toxin-antitoxin system